MNKQELDEMICYIRMFLKLLEKNSHNMTADDMHHHLGTFLYSYDNQHDWMYPLDWNEVLNEKE
jgi:hypothetical protein